MAYMKFEKKMLGGSDFFLDFLGPDLAQILGFGALRGRFWTIEIQKTPKLFRRPAVIIFILKTAPILVKMVRKSKFSIKSQTNGQNVPKNFPSYRKCFLTTKGTTF